MLPELLKHVLDIDSHSLSQALGTTCQPMATSQVAKSQRPFKFVLGGPAHLIHVLF